MTDDDRRLVYDTCKKARNNRIIITHGTDTILNSARTLSGLTGKIIVLVRASKPEKFKDSDASFNVGTAIGAINLLSNGVYIAMNGRVYHWDRCKKQPKMVNLLKNNL